MPFAGSDFVVTCRAVRPWRSLYPTRRIFCASSDIGSGTGALVLVQDARNNARIMEGRNHSILTRRFAAPSPSGRGNDLKVVPLPLGEGAAKRRVRIEWLD